MGTEQSRAGPGRMVMAGAIGNALEWYDFGLFGFFAPVISSQFFPSDDPRAALLNTFGVFAAGVLVRGPGAALFGALCGRMGGPLGLWGSCAVRAGAPWLCGLRDA